MKSSIYTGIALVLLALIGCSGPTSKETPQPNTVPIMAVANDKPESLQNQAPPAENRLSVTGYLDVPPENRASVSPYFGGFVKDIYVLPGQQVKKGDILFTLQNPDYLTAQQDYLEVKEQIEYLETDFRRQQQLAAESISSAKVYKKAESDYKVMLARYQSLREQIKMMSISIPALEDGSFVNTIQIVAPMDGTITAVNANNGLFIDASAVAVQMLNTEHIHLELEVYEKDALRIKKGQSIVFQLPETGQNTYKGEVHLVGKSIDPTKRTIRVHGHITKRNTERFIAGMYVEAEIIL